MERLEGDSGCFPVNVPKPDQSSPAAAAVNATSAEQNTTGASGTAGRGGQQAMSADDSRFLVASTEEILANFQVGDQISDQHRDKLAGLLRCYPEVFSRSYADIGSFKGEEVDLEL